MNIFDKVCINLRRETDEYVTLMVKFMLQGYLNTW